MARFASEVEPARRRPFWQPLAAALSQGMGPHELALTVSVGTVCAFFPVLGTATPLCFAAAVALRLNPALVQAVNAGTAPLYPALFVAFIRLGTFLIGARAVSFDFGTFLATARAHPSALAGQFGSVVGHAVVGWAVISCVWLPASYFAARFVLRRTKLKSTLCRT